MIWNDIAHLKGDPSQAGHRVHGEEAPVGVAHGAHALQRLYNSCTALA